MRQRVGTRTRAGLTLVVVAAMGFLLWPAQLGGATTYVSTTGVSMESRIHTGDLAIVRSADDYAVGDVTAYHSDMFDTVVMHRIVAVDAGHYTLQGDNNSWLDPDRPTRDQLIGKLALRIPQGGIWLDRLTSPTALGLLAFALLASGGTTLETRRRRRRRRRTVSQHAGPIRRMSMISLPPWGKTLGAAAALVAVVGLLLAVPAWSTAPSRFGEVESESDQTMAFSYRTEVPRSAAYDGTMVTSPDPVFRRLAETVDVRFSYRGRPGTFAVAAKLSTAGGWHSTVPLRPRVSFGSARYTETVRLNLKALEDRAQAAALVTGIPVTQVDIAVVPTVRTVDDTVFKPELALALTPLQLTLVGDKSSLTDRTSAVEETLAPAPGMLSIAGRNLSVSTARTLSLILTLGALLAALVLALLARLDPPGREGARIRRRYAPILIQVQPMPSPTGRPVVDVVDFPTLAKLAQRYGLLVMHWSRTNVETFVVQDEGTTYRYRTGMGDANVPVEVAG
ncbi:MAG TPA: signal peptidase I [Nocardioidaceae bacterium]|nr:signal peptidase I [Nocardioidaceae bacterium]